MAVQFFITFAIIMKKNLVYLIVLLVLGILTYYFVFKEKEDVFDKTEANFTVKDTAAVETIFLSDLQNQNIKLEKTKHGWTLNDSMVPRPDAIKNLLDILAVQKPEQAVPVSYHDAVIKDLSVNNVKVEIYTDKGKTNAFYVGKNAGPGNVTYMLSEGAKRPYIVKLPLQNLFLGVRYFTSLTEWRSKKILYAVSPIESVWVDYTDSSQYSYKIVKSDNDVTVSGNLQLQASLNKKRVYDYFKLLDNVYCTGYEDNYRYKDSVMKHCRSLATVHLKRKDIPEFVMTFYFKPPNQRTNKLIYIGNEQYEYEYFFGLINHKDFVLVSRKTTEIILRSLHEFYESDTK